jgi:hypothetical protein
MIISAMETVWQTRTWWTCVEASWNVMAHAQKPVFVFRPNGRVHLNQRGRQFSRLLAAEVCASAVVMLDSPCSEVVWRVLATLSIRQIPLHFSSRASPCTSTFQMESNAGSCTDKPITMNSTTAVNLIMWSRLPKHVVQILICSVHFAMTVVK